MEAPCPKMLSQASSFVPLKIDRIDAANDTKIDAEKVSKSDNNIIRIFRQNDREIGETNHLFAKG